jgi:2-polyprenyl-3-methyl-5-hydroxy-6-metoxy-1,4-benzoquinol methylase
VKRAEQGKLKMSAVKENSKQFWDKYFRNANYDYKSLGNKDWSKLIDRLKKYNVKNVLDLGCGYGHWSIILARAGFNVKAIDISSSAIKILKKWADEQDLSIDLEVCAAQEFKVFDDKFDAVICNSVLDHMIMNDTKIVLNNFNNILKPNGIAYISFDGQDKDTKDFVLLNDGTRNYIKGKFKYMLWRYCADKEIKDPCKDFAIIEFNARKNGRRNVWIKKKS